MEQLKGTARQGGTCHSLCFVSAYLMSSAAVDALWAPSTRSLPVTAWPALTACSKELGVRSALLLPSSTSGEFDSQVYCSAGAWQE